MKALKQRQVTQQMMISTEAMVSNSDMIKNYKNCRESAEQLGKIFILKNNQPDAVLFSIGEYERLSAFLEYLESLETDEMTKVIESMPVRGKRKTYSVDLLSDEQK